MSGNLIIFCTINYWYLVGVKKRNWMPN